MPAFGKDSLAHRATLHPELQRLLDEAIQHVDFAITCGHRGKAAQDKAVAEGKSKTPWPISKHNASPSLAVDVAPYSGGILWDDLEGFTLLAGILKGLSLAMKIPIRLGIDWDGDLVVKEHSFKDRPHIELIL